MVIAGKRSTLGVSPLRAKICPAAAQAYLPWQGSTSRAKTTCSLNALVFFSPFPFRVPIRRGQAMSDSSRAWLPVRLDDTDPSIDYSEEGWFSRSDLDVPFGNYGHAYSRTLHGTDNNGNLSFTFAGTAVSLTGVISSNGTSSGSSRPAWTCELDGLPIALSEGLGSVVFCDWRNVDQSGQHTLVFRSQAIPGNTVWVDMIYYVPTRDASLPNDTVIEVPHSSSAVVYTGRGWGTEQSGSQWAVSMKTFRNEESVQVDFVGTTISWWGYAPPENSSSFPQSTTSSYAIDGGAPTPFDLKGSPHGDPSWLFPFKIFEVSVPEGRHSLVVVNEGSQVTYPLSFTFLNIKGYAISSDSSAQLPISPSGGVPRLNSTATVSGSSPSEASANNEDSEQNVSVGAIAGGVVGGIAFLLLAVLALIIIMRRRRRSRSNSANLDGGHVVQPYQQAPFTMRETASWVQTDTAEMTRNEGLDEPTVISPSTLGAPPPQYSDIGRDHAGPARAFVKYR